MSLISSRAVLAAGALLVATGCGGLEPGDYIVYRIALQQSELSEDCFAGGAVPVNEQDDSSSLFTSGTFVLFMGADETPYLDTGAVTLAGEGSDDAYSFSGAFVDVTYNGAMQEVKLTVSSSLSIDLNVDGETVDGVMVSKDAQSCTAPDVATMCPDPPSSSCTTTTPFIGGEIEDVDLKHEV